jgi:predicted esterase
MTDTTYHTHSGNPVLTQGPGLKDATAAVILIHGRGASAADIIGLADPLTPDNGQGIAWMAPQATLNVWYPRPFTEPIANNQPALDSALRRIEELIDEATAAGVPAEKIALGGFSQGACLSLEFAARGTRPLGFVFGFAGGLIGDPKAERLPIPDLKGLPVYIGTGTADPLIGLDIVIRSVNLLRAAGARVQFEDFPGVAHTVAQQEILAVRTALETLVG